MFTKKDYLCFNLDNLISLFGIFFINEESISCSIFVDLYNCSSKTIANRIKKAGYKIQNGNIRRDVPNGHILHNENKNGISIKILAKKYNCHVETIRDRIKKCGYKIQNENIKTDIPDGETLYKEYKIEKSLQKLAKKI